MNKRILVGIIVSILITTFPAAAATTSLWKQAMPSSLYVSTVDNSILYGGDLGDIFVADMGNHVIRRIDALTGIITTVAGTGVAGNTLSETFNAHYGLAFDNSDFLFFTEKSNHTVRRLAYFTINLVAGTGVVGFSGDDSIAAFAQLVDQRVQAF